MEDSEDDALLLIYELRRGGYKVLHERVETPEDMQEALATSRWDVILSDYRMPHFGAPKALEMARTTGSETPVVVVSGKVGEEAAAEMIKAGAHDFLTKDNLARLLPAVQRALEETRERRRTERELRRRDAVLEAVRFAAERFLGETDGWEQNIKTVLGRLGEAAEASRVYVFENYTGEDGETWAAQRYEWTAPGVSAQIDNPLLKALPYRVAGFGRWVDFLGRGELVYGHTRELPESEQPELRAEDILSIVIVPIFVEGRWWGFVGFDECFVEREWSSAEMDALKAAASTLGAAVRRRRGEEALRQSEERYSLVVEGSNDGIFDWDVRTGAIYWNDRIYEMLGLSRSEDDASFEFFVELLHPEDRPRVLDAIRAHLQHRVEYNEEFRFRHSTGRWIHCIGRGRAQRDENGNPTRMAGAVTDITGRKRTEEALRQSEERYRAVVEQAAEGILLVDVNTKHVLEANAAYQRLVGYSSEEFSGLMLYDLVPYSREDMDCYVERVQEQGSYVSGERRHRRKDGSLVDVEVSASMISYGGGEALCIVVHDITERKQAEERVRTSEAELRALFEAMTDVVFVFNSEGRYLKVAPSNPALLYRPPEELLGKTLHEVLPREQADKLIDSIRQALAEQQTINCEYDLDIDGQRTWFEATISPMLEGTVVAVARDVTERKRAEEELKESERLYRTVIEQVTENICLVDVETRLIVGSNPAFRETLGYEQEDLEQMTLYDIVAHDNESVDRNVQRILEARRGSVGQRQYCRKDGSLVDVEVSSSIIVRKGRDTLCVVAHDVTERARIQKLLEERVMALSRVASNVTLELPMQEMLNALAKAVVEASAAVACIVSLSDEITATLHPVGSFGLPVGSISGLNAAWQAGAQSPTIRAFQTQESILVRNVRQFLLSNEPYRPVHHLVQQVSWDTVYIVPLISRGQALGTISFLYLPEEKLEEDEKLFLGAVADQTAVAVENARLLVQARGKAILEERQRLARELHDSVSQALYGIALGTKTARNLLDQNPQLAADPLEYVLSLAEAGMAEMRALIFELRPESLEKEGLVAALGKQAAALRARYGIEVETIFCDEPEVSLEVKETLYRIAQEALHNTVKHAHASNVEMNMKCNSELIILEISDNGVGFDAQGDFPGHLGLHSMQERTSRIGGVVEIESAPDKGTHIQARIPAR